MANKQIRDLPKKTTLTGEELIEIQDGAGPGSSKHAELSSLPVSEPTANAIAEAVDDHAQNSPHLSEQYVADAVSNAVLQHEEGADPHPQYATKTDLTKKADLVGGKIPIEQVPHGAMERCVVVPDEAARFALTTATVQNGDTVKQNDTGLMYFVVDDSNLDSEAGYEEYTAGQAASVAWANVTGKPYVTAGPLDTTPDALMKVGDFGISRPILVWNDDWDEFDSPGGTFLGNENTENSPWHAWTYMQVFEGLNGEYALEIATAMYLNRQAFRIKTWDGWQPWNELLHAGNTVVDTNGFLKQASPVLRLYRDRIEPNYEVPSTAEFFRFGPGHYVITGTPGLAQAGWCYEAPRDGHGSLLVFTNIEQSPDGTIVVNTYRPEYETGRLVPGEPMDIPDGRWVDIRLHAPPHSAQRLKSGED